MKTKWEQQNRKLRRRWHEISTGNDRRKRLGWRVRELRRMGETWAATAVQERQFHWCSRSTLHYAGRFCSGPRRQGIPGEVSLGAGLSMKHAARRRQSSYCRRLTTSIKLISICFITERANGDHHQRRMVGHCCSHKRHTDRQDCLWLLKDRNPPTWHVHSVHK